ncbi:MAG: thermonuclease family protein [Patescibacteria group bacterium]
MTTKKLLSYLTFSILLFISAWYAHAETTLPPAEKKEVATQNTHSTQKERGVEKEVATHPTTPPPTTPQASDLVPVVLVVDGDTLIAHINGKDEKIRLIGINTPETVDPRKPVECFGQEASKHAKEILTGTQIALEPDPTQDSRDKYGRLLRYVYLPDGTLFNQLMVEEGYAYEYTYQTPYQYQAQFKEAQSDAKSNNRGLWDPTTCNGKK